MATNCDFSVSKDGKKLTITVDLTQDHGASTSGKTNIIAKAREALGPGITLQMQVFRKN